MEFVFRDLDHQEGAVAEPGELHLRMVGAKSDGLATLILEKGLTAFQRGPGAITRIVLPAEPMFDDLFAATLATRILANQKLPQGFVAIARYAALGRQGRRPGGLPFEESLEGIFVAQRWLAGDLTEPQAADRFAASWHRMANRLLQAAEANLDPFTVPLFQGEAADAQEFLRKDRALYLEDAARGETWSIRLPGAPRREAALFLNQPRSSLFRYWCSSDTASGARKAHAFLAVHGGKGQWLFCADPPAPGPYFHWPRRCNRPSNRKRTSACRRPFGKWTRQPLRPRSFLRKPEPFCRMPKSLRWSVPSSTQESPGRKRRWWDSERSGWPLRSSSSCFSPACFPRRRRTPPTLRIHVWSHNPETAPRRSNGPSSG